MRPVVLIFIRSIVSEKRQKAQGKSSSIFLFNNPITSHVKNSSHKYKHFADPLGNDKYFWCYILQFDRPSSKKTSKSFVEFHRTTKSLPEEVYKIGRRSIKAEASDTRNKTTGNQQNCFEERCSSFDHLSFNLIIKLFYDETNNRPSQLFCRTSKWQIIGVVWFQPIQPLNIGQIVSEVDIK